MSYNPQRGNVISVNNSTTALLGAGATFTGAWEEVVNYTTIAVAVLGSVATDGTLFFDLSTDGGTTFTSVPSTIGDTTFAVPRILNVVETHVRIRYVNGSTPMTGTFSIQTKYSNGQELALLGSVDGFINDEYPVNAVKSISAGKSPNGNYVNTPASGTVDVLSTTTPLGASGNWTTDWVDIGDYGEIKVAMSTDVDAASCLLQLSHDGITVDTSLSLPPQLIGSAYTFIHSLNPSLPFFRVNYTNNGVAQTYFKFKTTLLVQTGNGFISRASQVLDRYTDVRNQRVVNSPEQDRNFGLINYQAAQRKFGSNVAVGTSFVDIRPDGFAVVFPTATETIRVKAGGNVNDTAAGSGAQKVYIEALDTNGDEILIELDTAGTSASAASVSTVSAVNRVYTKGKNAGNIVIENTTSLEILAVVETGYGTTRQQFFTVPNNKTMWITKIYPSVANGNSADIELWHIENIDGLATDHYEWGIPGFLGAGGEGRETFLKFVAGSKVYGRAKKHDGSGSASVTLDYDYILTDN